MAFLTHRFKPGSSWHTASGAALAVLLVAGMGFAHAAKAGAKPPYTYTSVGNPALEPTISQNVAAPSYVLMGGGPDVDEAYRWMMKQAGIKPGSGGRLVVIRATGDGAYDPYMYYSNAASSTASADIVDGWVGGASLGLSSAETLVIPSTVAANDPFVNAIVARANVVWIAGGDQSDYLKFWKGQKLEATLKALMAKNVPIGGTSAGLAVLGQFDFAAMNGTVTSAQAISDPYNRYMTFDPNPLSTTGGFIAPAALANTITDSHVDARDRLGRLITFVSRLVAPYPGSGTQLLGCTGGVLKNSTARGIGVSVESALLVDWDPVNAHFNGRRVTNSPAPTTEAAVYFVSVTQGPTTCAAGKTLAVPSSSVQIRKLANSTGTINLSDWTSLPLYKSVGITAGVVSPDPY
jgi:cyanophycinase-like exopeptidase